MLIPPLVMVLVKVPLVKVPSVVAPLVEFKRDTVGHVIVVSPVVVLSTNGGG